MTTPQWTCNVCGKHIPVGQMIAHYNVHSRKEVAEAFRRNREFELAKKSKSTIDAYF